MSAPDARSSSSDAPPADENVSRRSGGASGRLVVLLLILLVVGIAAGWDYLVARPAFYEAQKKVEPLLPGSAPDAEEEVEPVTREPATQKDVHAALGLTPGVTESAGAYLVERYSWRRGVPWLTYDLWVIYDDDAERTLRSATSVREEADLYYATANRPGASASDPAADAETDAGAEPADAEAPGAPADDSPDAPADDS